MRTAVRFACLVAVGLLPLAAVAQSASIQSATRSIVEQLHELRRLRAGGDLDDEALAQQRFEHPRLAQYLAIEPALERRLLKMLLEHVLEDSTSQSPILTGSRSDDRDDPRRTRERTQQLERRREQLRELLGTERLQRFQVYQRTLHLRRQLAAFELELPPLDSLTPEQTERMVELMLQAQESAAPAMWQRPFDIFIGNKRGNPFAGDIWETQETIARYEHSLHLLEAVTDLTLQPLSQLLRPEQVRAYAKFQAAEINRLREAIARLRHAANLPDAIPEPPATGELPLPTA